MSHESTSLQEHLQWLEAQIKQGGWSEKNIPVIEYLRNDSIEKTLLHILQQLDQTFAFRKTMSYYSHAFVDHVQPDVHLEVTTRNDDPKHPVEYRLAISENMANVAALRWYWNPKTKQYDTIAEGPGMAGIEKVYMALKALIQDQTMEQGLDSAESGIQALKLYTQKQEHLNLTGSMGETYDHWIMQQLEKVWARYPGMKPVYGMITETYEGYLDAWSVIIPEFCKVYDTMMSSSLEHTDTFQIDHALS